jgi:hypothetical protein
MRALGAPPADTLEAVLALDAAARLAAAGLVADAGARPAA